MEMTRFVCICYRTNVFEIGYGDILRIHSPFDLMRTNDTVLILVDRVPEKELVFANMTIGQGEFREVFGEDFETLFFEWAADNQAFCTENGLKLIGSED